ncbi:MAG: hypothetical protein ACYDHP_08715 [Ferrimicrobium sp.]
MRQRVTRRFSFFGEMAQEAFSASNGLPLRGIRLSGQWWTVAPTALGQLLKFPQQVDLQPRLITLEPTTALWNLVRWL